MGNGVSNDQGNFPAHGKRDVMASVCKGQHDWSQLAEAPETHSLSTSGNYYRRKVAHVIIIKAIYSDKKAEVKTHTHYIPILTRYLTTALPLIICVEAENAKRAHCTALVMAGLSWLYSERCGSWRRQHGDQHHRS